MLLPFFVLATRSQGQQRTFRRVVAAHLGLLICCWLWTNYRSDNVGLTLGYVLLTAGIVEGAMLMGWRLTQLPRSRALEFLLVSPLRPRRVLVAEALVGLSRIALVTLSGLPLLVLFVFAGYFEPIDLLLLLIMPFTWGAITGLGLTAWAYEPLVVRRWAERIMLVTVVFYLAVGVLAGEHLGIWIGWLPARLGELVLDSLEAFHRYNPFAIVRLWLTEDLPATWERTLAVEALALSLVGLLLTRTAFRLHGHFQERHYRPAIDSRGQRRRSPADRPLTWWALRRVTEYSGRVNFWLAGGFGILYALYTMAGSSWPGWMGRSIFVIFDRAGGIPVWSTALVILAAVPAAFQYGLWDSNAQDRRRRLELLLMTGLTGEDYWEAAVAAAWRRGRGYFGVAVLLWLAAAIAGITGFAQALAALAAGVVLWGLYFALGFRAFSRGMEAGSSGLVLTIGLPILLAIFQHLGWGTLAALSPPGSVYFATGSTDLPAWWIGSALSAFAALFIARHALTNCDIELRRWYDRHHGQKADA